MTLDYVLFTSSAGEVLHNFLSQRNYSHVGVLVDQHTLAHCYPRIQAFLPEHVLIEIQSGEEHKTLDTCAQIWSQMTDVRLDRKSILLNLGGGVIGDMGGFCAATYKRGIDFIQVPTTLLAQVDASVGGKLGIDFKELKNHIGLFRQPERVIIDVNFLSTLSSRELRSGLAEVIKHCLIADANAWQNLRQEIGFFKQCIAKPALIQDHIAQWEYWVRHSVGVKAKVVEQDPSEKGLRKILNFGHTLGHALESYYLGDPAAKLLHGEAIALGMILESHLSLDKLLPEHFQEIESFIEEVYDTVDLSSVPWENITQRMLQDKKNVMGQVRFSLLDALGKANFDQQVAEEKIKEAIDYYIRNHA